ncbi:MAG: CpsD/CapB family tyrosine-protein kinase [Acidimicrobiales bacterium]|nr:CpsD/CapB family tyrosine-protein kinase [Acidimicrobiales bacterium]
MDEDELITRRALRSLRKAAPIAVLVAIAAGLAAFLTQTVSDPTYSSKASVELTDEAAAGIGASRTRNDALQEIAAQLLRLESAEFEVAVAERMGDQGDDLIRFFGTNSEETPVIVITAEATNAQAAQLGVDAAVDEFVAQRVVESNENLSRELTPLREQRDQVLADIDALRAQLDEARANGATQDEISILENRTGQALDRLGDYDKAIQEREFLIASSAGEVRVINRATPAVESAQSSIMRPVQIAVLALVLTLIAAVVISRVRGKLNLLDDVRAVAGPDVPILATIPKFRKKFSDGSAALVVGRRNARREAEAFRYMRTAIEVATEGQTPLVVAFTSANPNEGKSVTAGNYALAMARSGRSTVVLDGDLLNSTVSELFDAEGQNAFAAVMHGNVDPTTEQWFEYPTSGEPVTLLVSPKAKNSASRYELASSHVNAVYGKLETSWNTVVVDCPPALAVSDALVLAKEADVAILVVRMGKTSRRELDNALIQCEQAGVRLAGIVTTHSTEKAESYYGYGYSYGGGGE